MMKADSFCSEPASDASAEEAFCGVESCVGASASVMLPNSPADSTASYTDLASEDAGAEGGGDTGAAVGWDRERGHNVWFSHGRGGKASALGGSEGDSGGGGGSGGREGEDGEELLGGGGVRVGPAEGGGGGHGGAGAGAGVSDEMVPSREGRCEGGKESAMGSAAGEGGGGRIGEAIKLGLVVAGARANEERRKRGMTCCSRLPTSPLGIVML